MTTSARIGMGTIVEVSTNSGGSWTELGEVTNFEPPSDTIDQIDVTHMRSPNRRREFIQGLTDGGNCTVEMNFVPGSTTDQLIRSIIDAAVNILCRVTWPGSPTVVWTFEASTESYTISAAPDDKLSATWQMKTSGATTIS